MLDFLDFSIRETRNSVIISPIFKLGRKWEDLMIRGGDFYAVWDEDHSAWSQDEDVLIQLIDRELRRVESEQKERTRSFERVSIVTNYLSNSDSGAIDKWHKYCQHQSRDFYHPLDAKIMFSNEKINKTDYATRTLPYPIEEMDIPSYDTLMSTLYDEQERHKLEWAIGAVITGHSKEIQKFIVMYGAGGTGKSTVLNIIQQLFDGYYSMFDAKALGSANDSFALEPFKANPLVAIQHDGDLSHIEDNTRLNSIVSHEEMVVNEKHKSLYTMKFNAFLFMGTNRPVRITDAKSGILRRLIDVSPSGRLLNKSSYDRNYKRIKFELPGIAYRCRQVYLDNPQYYDAYVPISMMDATNDFYNFVMEEYEVFAKEDETTLKQAWAMYNEYCEYSRIPYPYTMRVFKAELKNYFDTFEDRGKDKDGNYITSLYRGFQKNKFLTPSTGTEAIEDDFLIMEPISSVFDIYAVNFTAQYANVKEMPFSKWSNVTTTLQELDTSRLHYVKVPTNHIVIDFDLKDETGKKSFELNHKAASKWPKTYAELSKSGQGIHLHYNYVGDPTKLCRIYDDDIEIKVFTGNSSLRRKLTMCNREQIATISSGLPLKGETKMVNFEGLKSEKALRTLIKRNLNKEIWPNTKPSVDLIYKSLEDAYNSGMKYDVTDMRPAVLSFALGSTNQSQNCLTLVGKMKFKSEEDISPEAYKQEDEKFIFFDVEVFPNLFVVVWKKDGEPCIRMINPSANMIEELVQHKLIGFNNRRYDNHIMYARMLGYTNEQLFELSKRIVSGSKNAMFGNAYNLSYTDIYDFCSEKMSLKKWEIKLGIHHQELGLDWDKPVPEELWELVAEYCENDVIATEAVFHAREGDFLAREILADIAEMTPNDTTNSLTTKIIFGNDKKPDLVYTDLSEEFPGYKYVSALESEDKKAHNIYKGEDVGFGGLVWAQPGMYGETWTFDVRSMHPYSAIALNYFGKYTERFKELVEVRGVIKHKDFEKAKTMLGGMLAPYLNDPSKAKMLAQALKIAINSVYGLTSASFDNPFRDSRNVNNIVALRGALFMATLRDEVIKRGGIPIHVKTDSIKILNPSKEMYDFVMDFGKKYGYDFEIEHKFEKICLVNNAVYIAKLSEEDDEWKESAEEARKNNSDVPTRWTATGTQFQVPFVFKSLFSKENITFEDYCETKTVQTALYLDLNENLPNVEDWEKELKKQLKYAEPDEDRIAFLKDKIKEGHDYHFVGKAGSFCPIQPGYGGGILLRKSGEDKYASATGADGYRWLEYEMVKELHKENEVDKSYHRKLANEAIETISEFGDFEMFAS